MALQDMERGMFIYHARKDDKRTFADIGRELGISPSRVRYIYTRLDWNLNRYNADHHQKAPKTTKRTGKIIPFPGSKKGGIL